MYKVEGKTKRYLVGTLYGGNGIRVPPRDKGHVMILDSERHSPDLLGWETSKLCTVKRVIVSEFPPALFPEADTTKSKKLSTKKAKKSVAR